MRNAREIKKRINGIQDTKKIVNAMYLISSSKMRKVKADLDHTRPFFNALLAEIKRIFRTVEGVENRYFYPADGSAAPEGTYGLLVITADKGLAGAYNKSVIKEAQRMMTEHPDSKPCGRRIRQAVFLRQKRPLNEAFIHRKESHHGEGKEISISWIV